MGPGAACDPRYSGTRAPLLPRIWQLRDNLTASDAAYVTLAERLDATLITCDGRLAEPAAPDVPKYDVVRQGGAVRLLGEVRTAALDHGEGFDESHRIMRPDLAGGCLPDLGVHTVVVADDLLGSGRVVGACDPAPRAVPET